MDKTRIAVLVSGGGTNLQALIDAQKSGIISDGEIVLVVSNSSTAYALTRAADNGIKSAVVTRKQYGEKFEEQLLSVLKENNIELIILAGFMSILTADFVKNYPDRIINVHPALIPSFCGKGYYGLKVHEEALKYGVKVSGATVHLVNEIPDGGKILFQKAVDVMDDDTPETLQKRIMEQAEWILLPRAAQMISRKIREEKQ